MALLSFVQGAYASDSSGSTASLTHGFTPTSGNWLICAVCYRDQDGPFTATPTGFTEITETEWGAVDEDHGYWVGYREATGTEPSSYSGTFTGSGRWTIALLEFSGPTGFDKAVVGAGSDDDADDTTNPFGPITPTNDDSAVVVLHLGFSNNSWVSGFALDAGGYTLNASEWNDNFRPPVRFAYRTLTASTLQSGTFTTTGAGEKASTVAVAFDMPSTGGGSPPTFLPRVVFF